MPAAWPVLYHRYLAISAGIVVILGIHSRDRTRLGRRAPEGDAAPRNSIGAPPRSAWQIPPIFVVGNHILYTCCGAAQPPPYPHPCRVYLPNTNPAYIRTIKTRIIRSW